MTSWLQGLVPGPVKRAFSALYTGECRDTATQAYPPSAHISPEQTVAPAPSSLPDTLSALSPDLHSPLLPPSEWNVVPCFDSDSGPPKLASDSSDCDNCIHIPSPLRTQTEPARRPTRSHTPNPRHSAPVTSVSWHQWVGCAPPSHCATPAASSSSATSILQSAATLLQHVHTTINTDGSYSSGCMGLGAVSHHHLTGCTRLFASSPAASPEDSSMLAEALALIEALLDALSHNSTSIHIITDSRTLRQLVLGREQLRGPDRVGKALATVTQQIITTIRKFDTV